MSVSQLARPRGSLRQWLLGASVVAVLAGYGVLLMAYAWLADLDRRDAHRQLGSEILALVEQERSLPAESSLSGVDAWIEDSGQRRSLFRALDRRRDRPPSALVRLQQRAPGQPAGPGFTRAVAISPAACPWGRGRPGFPCISCRM